jgi:hypothetical protein
MSLACAAAPLIISHAERQQEAALDDRHYLDDNNLDGHRPHSERGKKVVELLRSKGKGHHAEERTQL